MFLAAALAAHQPWLTHNDREPKHSAAMIERQERLNRWKRRMERDKTTLRTEKQAHIVTLDEATCFKEREARICEGYRVWHGNGDGVGQAAWREVTPTDMGWTELVETRRDVSQLPVRHLAGHYYFWESYRFVDNFAHWMNQHAPKLRDYMRLRARGAPVGLLMHPRRDTSLAREYLHLLNLSATVLEMGVHYTVDVLSVSPYRDNFDSSEDNVWILRAPVELVARRPAVRAPAPLVFLDRDVHANRSANNNAAGAKRVIRNHDRLAEALRRRGFAHVTTASMTLEDRVELFSALDTVVTQSGANLLNLCFARKRPRRAIVIQHELGIQCRKLMATIWPGFEFEVIHTSPTGDVDVPSLESLLEQSPRPQPGA